MPEEVMPLVEQLARAICEEDIHDLFTDTEMMVVFRKDYRRMAKAALPFLEAQKKEYYKLGFAAGKKRKAEEEADWLEKWDAYISSVGARSQLVQHIAELRGTSGEKHE